MAFWSFDLFIFMRLMLLYFPSYQSPLSYPKLCHSLTNGRSHSNWKESSSVIPITLTSSKNDRGHTQVQHILDIILSYWDTRRLSASKSMEFHFPFDKRLQDAIAGRNGQRCKLSSDRAFSRDGISQLRQFELRVSEGRFATLLPATVTWYGSVLRWTHKYANLTA